MLLWVALAAATDQPPPIVPREAPDERMPARLWDLTHLDLDVALDLDARSVSGTATHHLEALGRPRDRLRLHQRALDIQAVRVDGRDATFTVGHDWLDVELPPGTRHTVAIDYQTRPAKGLYFRSPAWGDAITEVFTQGEDEDNRWWFPGWDHPNDRFTVTTHVTAPEQLVVRALGEQVARSPVEGGRSRWSFALDQPVVNYLVTLVAGDYQVVELDGPVPIEVLAARTVPRAVVERTAADLPDMVDFYAELLDEPFPYSRLRLVYVQRFLYGGMENPTLTVMNDNLLVAHDDALARRRSNEVSAHEVVHHWFGDLVTCHGWNPWWLNEGFARYYEERYIGHRYGDEAMAVNLLAASHSARELPRALEPSALTREPDTPIATWNGSYPKGAMVLHGLREDLTPGVYDKGIAHYIDANRLGFVEGNDLRRSLEALSGTSLVWFFDQFVTGRGLPAYTVSSSFGDGELVLTIEPKDDTGVFHLPVVVEIGTSSGPVRRTLQLDGSTTRLQLPLDTAPDWLVVDPDRTRLASFDHEQSTAAWIAALTRSERPTVRLLAMNALGNGDGHESALHALHAIARSDADVIYRSHAVHALGKHAALHMVAPWLRRLAVDEREGPLRRAAVQSLANTPESLDLLASIAFDDPLPAVQVSALRTLGEHDGQRAVEVARRRLQRPDTSLRGTVHANALSVLGEHGTHRDHRALADGLSSSGYRTRQAAFWAVSDRLGGLAPGPARTRLQTTLAAAVAFHLDDPEFDARWLALEVARHLREEHIPMLQRFRAANPVESLDDQAAAAIRAIRTPWTDTETPERLDALQRAVDALRNDLDTTKERLDELDRRP